MARGRAVVGPDGGVAPSVAGAGLTMLRVGGLLGLANLAGAVVVFVFLNEILAPFDGRPVEERGIDARVVFVAYMAVALVVGGIAANRLLWRTGAWLADPGPPTPDQRDLALRLPGLLAAIGLVGWLGAIATFGVANVASGETLQEVVRICSGILLGGLSTTALTYLVVERGLRPVFVRALAAGLPAETRTVGIRLKLVLSWALGSGVPLLGIAVAPLGERTQASVGDLAALAGIGLVSGGLMVGVAARSVGDRLVVVRSALRQVQRGDTDVTVTVDEGGDLGLLQAGLNEMVAGVRERERLRDLFGRHVGDEVARQALEREGGLGGEQREVSALFVDLIGSTALAATRPADEVVAVLNALFGAVVVAAAAEGGWVNKFEGDGALCVFGAPDHQPDHARRALRAARALRDELARLRLELPALDAGIAVSSGLVVAGNVGAERRYEYTVIGDPVNEAARLTEHAKARPGRLVASLHAVELAGAEEAACWRGVGTVELRGRSAPTSVHEPVPSSPSDRGASAGVGRGALPPSARIPTT